MAQERFPVCVLHEASSFALLPARPSQAFCRNDQRPEVKSVFFSTHQAAPAPAPQEF
jgi:hypothetical protein